MKNEDVLIKKVAEKIAEKGGKIYFVGGCVRDKNLGLENKDIDVEMYGLNLEEIREILEKFGKIDLVGASFGIYKIHGVDIDFCFPRKETLIGKGHKDFEVSIEPYISTQDAAKRRDFTINSIMQDVNTGEIIDHFDGRGDLKRKVIKHIDDRTFMEDPLRVLRACQFAARLEFEIDERTVELCKKIDIHTLPIERIYEEIKKGFMKAKKPSVFIEKLIQIEKLETIFPNICIEQEKIQTICELLDNSAHNKGKSNHPEYFMFASFVYGLKKMDRKADVKELVQALSKNKEFGVAVENLVNKKLELDEMIENRKELTDYQLKKLAIESIDKYHVFNIDDVVLLEQSSQLQGELISEQLSKRVNQIGLNENRTIERKYTGKDLKELGISKGKRCGEILDEIFELQLQDVPDEEIQKYLNDISQKEFVKKIANKVAQKGGNCYFFGGYVRDRIIGKKPNDMDIQIIGMANEELKKVLENFGEVVLIGKSFPILKLKSGVDIDFLTPEDEKGNLLSVKDAQKRIDFTMNSVFEDVLTGERVDYFRGVEDIKRKVIHMTDKETFSKDKVRSLRACRFASELNFDISQDTMNECQKFEFDERDKLRAYEEVKKVLLRSSNPSTFFDKAYEMGIVSKLFAPMESLKELEQEEKYHPEGNVWNHTMKVLDFAAYFRDKAEDKIAFMMAALCHDFGKISTTAIKIDKTGKPKITAYGHDNATEESEFFMRNLEVPKKIMGNVLALQKTHMRPDVIYREQSKLSSVKKLIEDSNEQLNDLLLLSDCDRLGSGLEVSKEKQEYIKNRRSWWNEQIQKIKKMEEQNKVQTISGKELIELGFKPGPLFAIIQDEYKQLTMDGVTREDIMSYILAKYGGKIEKGDIASLTKDISFDEVKALLSQQKEKSAYQENEK